MIFGNTFVAGTFDGLHKGHLAVLSSAFKVGAVVTIGITSDEFVKQFKKGLDTIRPYDVRKKELFTWLESVGFSDRSQIISIDSPIEPAASDAFEAIIVSSESKARANEINSLRHTRGLPILRIIVVPMIMAYDGKPISSTRVRSDEIDKNGNRIMPDILRDNLSHPIGPVLTPEQAIASFSLHEKNIIVAVGDVTTKMFFEHECIPTISIIDLNVRREPFNTFEFIPRDLAVNIFSVESGPGYITPQAEAAVDEALITPGNNIIIVGGEEDLLVLTAISKVPVGSYVYYGQPPTTEGDKRIEGLVEVAVTDEIKKQIENILLQFTK
jgi:pantetheine-phosphate adenylyltransferase